MEYLLLCVSVVLGSAKSVLSKSASLGGGMFNVFKSNVALFTVAFAVVFVFAAAGYDGNAYAPVLPALLYALSTLFSQISLAAAVGLGPVSVSSLFYSCGFIVPTLWSCLYYGEGVNALHIAGIAVVLLSFALGAGAEKDKKPNVKWLVAALGGALFSGFSGVIQKVFAIDYSHASVDVFLCTAFMFTVGISLVLSVAAYAVMRRKPALGGRGACRAVTPSLVVQTIALGAVMGLLNKLNTYLSGALPGAVMFPVTNCGVIALASIASAIVFKERPTARQCAAIAAGFAAIALIAAGQYV